MTKIISHLKIHISLYLCQSNLFGFKLKKPRNNNDFYYFKKIGLNDIVLKMLHAQSGTRN